MKIDIWKKTITILFASGLIVFLLLGLTHKFYANNFDDNKEIAKVENKTESATLDMKSMSNEELYKQFGYHTDQELEDVYGNSNESDKVVILSVGGVFKGQLSKPVNESSESIIEVDSETDPHAITMKEMKQILKEKKTELFELYNKEINGI